MKTLICGANGMLGHALMKAFQDWHPTGWDVQELDITNQGQVREKIAKLKPQLIINAAAYTNVDKAEQERDLAFKINALGVDNLAKAASTIGAIFVHYSTDYVFEGIKKEGYAEDDIPQNPVNAYGASKLAGEKAILDLRFKIHDLRYYLIRSSWLFGPDGKNFAQTIIDLSKNESQMSIVSDQWGKPTYTVDLAQATKQLIDNHYHFGIYHLVNEPKATWYSFAEKIVAIAYANHSQMPSITPVLSSEFPRPAKRPHYSILLNKKAPQLRGWSEALKDYLV